MKPKFLLEILALGAMTFASAKAQDTAKPAPAAAADAGFVHYAHNDHLNRRGNDLRKLLEQDSVNVYELDEATMLAIGAHKADAKLKISPMYFIMINEAIIRIATLLPDRATDLEVYNSTDTLTIHPRGMALNGKSPIIQKPEVDYLGLTPSERLNGSLAKLDKALKTEPLNARELNLATFYAIADCKLYMSENSPDSLQEYSIQILGLLDSAMGEIKRNSPHIAAALEEDIEELKSKISSTSIWDSKHPLWKDGNNDNFWRKEQIDKAGSQPNSTQQKQ